MIRWNIEKLDAFYGKFDLDDLLDEVLDGVDHYLLDKDQEDNGPSDYTMLNPDFLDLNSDEQGDSSEPSTGPVASRFVKNESLPPAVFFEMYSLLNEEQQKLFNFIIRYSQELKLNKGNYLPESNPFHIFLSGAAGVGKSFLTKLIAEYMKKLLKTAGQNMDEHPAVVVTTSKGKAAINVNDTTLHSAFGGESMLLIDNFLQLSASVWIIFEHLTPTNACHLFKLHKLTKNFRQNSDPEFAELLNEVHFGKQTQCDIAAIHAMADTDISGWPENHFRSYMTNHLLVSRIWK